MPASATSDSRRKSASLPVSARPVSPRTTATRARSVVRCRPTWCAAVGASAPNTAKPITGSDVSSPAVGPPIPKPSRISASTGPTLTAAGRRFSESRTMLTRTRAVVRRAEGLTRTIVSGALSAGSGRMCPMRPVTDVGRRRGRGRRHALAPGPGAATPEAATAAMTVLHATEAPSVYLSLWARVDGLTVADVDRALYADRSLVKQLAMRRTLFVFPRELLPAAWGSASARVAAAHRVRLAKDVERGGVATDGAAWVDAAEAAVLARLADGSELSASELREQVPALAGRVEMSPGKTYGGSFPIAPRLLTQLGVEGKIGRGHNGGHRRPAPPPGGGGTTRRGEPPEPPQ